MPVPFGSTVSQIPFALKEVLLFQGENRNPNEPDDAECYSKSGVPLTFRGIQADDYVLCFVRDRLYRVETVLRLPKDVPADTMDEEQGAARATRTNRHQRLPRRGPLAVAKDLRKLSD